MMKTVQGFGVRSTSSNKTMSNRREKTNSEIKTYISLFSKRRHLYSQWPHANLLSLSNFKSVVLHIILTLICDPH